MGILDRVRSKKNDTHKDQGTSSLVPKTGSVDETVASIDHVAAPQGQGLQMKSAGNKRFGVKEYRILVKPLITEKTVMSSTYQFEVEKSANKIEIKKAFFNVYGIMPVSVTTAVQKGKNVRYGRTKGTQKDWKKAIITLKKGEKIDTF